MDGPILTFLNAVAPHKAFVAQWHNEAASIKSLTELEHHVDKFYEKFPSNLWKPAVQSYADTSCTNLCPAGVRSSRNTDLVRQRARSRSRPRLADIEHEDIQDVTTKFPSKTWLWACVGMIGIITAKLFGNTNTYYGTMWFIESVCAYIMGWIALKFLLHASESAAGFLDRVDDLDVSVQLVPIKLPIFDFRLKLPFGKTAKTGVFAIIAAQLQDYILSKRVRKFIEDRVISATGPLGQVTNRAIDTSSLLNAWTTLVGQWIPNTVAKVVSPLLSMFTNLGLPQIITALSSALVLYAGLELLRKIFRGDKGLRYYASTDVEERKFRDNYGCSWEDVLNGTNEQYFVSSKDMIYLNNCSEEEQALYINDPIRKDNRKSLNAYALAVRIKQKQKFQKKVRLTLAAITTLITHQVSNRLLVEPPGSSSTIIETIQWAIGDSMSNLNHLLGPAFGAMSQAQLTVLLV